MKISEVKSKVMAAEGKRSIRPEIKMDNTLIGQVNKFLTF
jgi:hypothetical protein